MASDVAVDLTSPKFVTTIWIAGGSPDVTFVDLLVRLQHPDGDDDQYVEWEAEVGFVDNWRAPWPMLLGQHGFFDQFSVTMHCSAALTVVEDWAAFDQRFGIQPGEADQHRARFEP